jgi:hypothetical protein
MAGGEEDRSSIRLAEGRCRAIRRTEGGGGGGRRLEVISSSGVSIEETGTGLKGMAKGVRDTSSL